MGGGHTGKIMPSDGNNMGLKFLSFRMNGVSSNSVTITKPTGVANKDLLLGFFNHRSSTFNLPAGWTSIAITNPWNGTSGYSRVAYKLANNEGASYTIACNNGIILAYRYATQVWYAGTYVRVTAGVTTLNLPKIPGTKLVAFYANYIAQASRTFSLSTGTEICEAANTGRFSHGAAELYPNAVTITRAGSTNNEFAGCLIGLV